MYVSIRISDHTLLSIVQQGVVPRVQKVYKAVSILFLSNRFMHAKVSIRAAGGAKFHNSPEESIFMMFHRRSMELQPRQCHKDTRTRTEPLRDDLQASKAKSRKGP